MRPCCGFAHRLCDLRAPDERTAWHSCAWEEGVDRWFGQSMSRAQLRILGRYYEATPAGETPLWFFGLSPMIRGAEWEGAAYLPWDYGLEQDQDLLQLCLHQLCRGSIDVSQPQHRV